MKPVLDIKATAGECPVWSEIHQLLLWVDIWEKKIHLTDVTTLSDRVIDLPEMIGYVAPCSDGTLLAAMETCLAICDASTGEMIEKIPKPRCMPATHRFNEGIIDGKGRVIVGTMKKSQIGKPEDTGKLYRYDGEWSILLEGFWTVNGLAFSPDGGLLYISDSFVDVQSIWSMKYDVEFGRIGERALFVDMKQYPGRPDGGAVDVEGNYWIAAVGGWCVLKFSSDGLLLKTLTAPVEKTTKVAFGGTLHNRMFCTSLSVLLTEGTEQPFAGSLFEFTPGVNGLVPQAFKRI